MRFGIFRLWLLFFIFFLGMFSYVCAGSLRLTTYYPIPYAGYEKLRFLSRDSSGLVCDASMEGLFFLDSATGQFLVCSGKNGLSWKNLEGIWIQSDDGSLGDVILKSASSIDLIMGIGTANPEFRLTLDKDAVTPDGGILAIGTFGSGQDLVTSGAGTRLIWYPKKAAFRAGQVGAAQWNDGNIGDYSVAFGKDTIASGTASFAAGFSCSATGYAGFAAGYLCSSANSSSGFSMAVGDRCQTNHIFQIAMGSQAVVTNGYFAIGDGVLASEGIFAGGQDTEAAGQRSFSFGLGTVAPSFESFVAGRYNLDTVVNPSSSPVSNQLGDALFMIGNGQDELNRHNAVTLLKYARMGINTEGLDDVEFRLTLDKGAAAPDGGILAIGTFGSGRDLVTSGAGTRLIWYPKKAAFRAGYVDGVQWDDGNIGGYSFAGGNGAEVSGDASFAVGSSLDVSGGGSFAVGATNAVSADAGFAAGDSCSVSGAASFAAGLNASASGGVSFAYGNAAKAVGEYSAAIGDNVTAQAYASMVVGRYNVISGDSSAWKDTDPLFVIGNGTGFGAFARHNALTVLKNGNVGVNTDTPQSALQVNGYLQVRKYTIFSAVCRPNLTGRMEFHSDNKLYICNGSSWVSF